MRLIKGRRKKEIYNKFEIPFNTLLIVNKNHEIYNTTNGQKSSTQPDLSIIILDLFKKIWDQFYIHVLQFYRKWLTVYQTIKHGKN